MDKDLLKEAALKYHSEGRPGKIEVIPTTATANQRDLSLAYSPGVAEPCLAIHETPDDVYKYTAKGNLVAVISNGTAVLGLGDMGPAASKPVMEGKGLLFKIYADIDCFDLELNTKNVDEFIRTVKFLEPTFGGVNLEDISAPACFEIEERLKEELNKGDARSFRLWRRYCRLPYVLLRQDRKSWCRSKILKPVHHLSAISR